MREPGGSLRWTRYTLPRMLVVLAIVVVALAFVGGSSAVSTVHHHRGLAGLIPRLGRIIPQRLPPFIASDDGYDGIVLMKPDGSDLHAVGPLPSPDGTAASEPSWSPRATRILYVMGCEIWVMKADGRNQRRLIRSHGIGGCGGVNQPHWSPDGKRIVYVGGGPNTADSYVHVAKADGSHDHLLPDTDGAEFASFSPDGQYILFEASYYPTYKPDFYLTRPNGKGLRRIALLNGGEDAALRNGAEDPGWSPNGRFIIYACSFYPNPITSPRFIPSPVPHAVCEISRAHPKPRILFSVPLGGFIFNPVWSADGKKILFQINDTSGYSQLALLAASGGRPDVITHNDDYSYVDADW